MTERNRKILVFLTLPAALIWAYFNIGDSGTQTPSLPTQPATIQPLPAGPPAVQRAKLAVDDRLAEPWGKDPFRSQIIDRPVARDGDEPGWWLGGIIYTAGNPMAIVNQQSVKIGDQVNNATVVAITKREVVLALQGREFTLTVDKG